MVSNAEPYVGPRPFERGDYAIFVGRRQETCELVSLITAHPVVLLYAPSGAGKTSLLKAKLIPSLEEEEDFCVLPPARVRCQDSSLVGDEVLDNVYIFSAIKDLSDSRLSVRDRLHLRLNRFLHDWRLNNTENNETLKDKRYLPTVIIFDQFEELFTLYPDCIKDRRDFFEQVREALDDNPSLRVVFSMREDYIAELHPYADILPEKLRTRFRLELLRKEAALAAVEEPLTVDVIKYRGRKYAPGVAEKLVNNLLTKQVKSLNSEPKEVLGEFVDPVQLQVVCQTLWDNLQPEDTEITEKHLEEFGNVNQALSNFYERCLKKALDVANNLQLTNGHSINERSLRHWFEQTLITPEKTRGIVFRGREETGGIPNQIVDELQNLHLIRAELREGDTWYELSHERFIQPVRDSNKRWSLEQPVSQRTAQELEERANKWLKAGRANVLLLNQGELANAKNWLNSSEARNIGYSETLYSLFQASQAAMDRAEREREQAFALEQQRRAEAEYKRAEAEKHRAEEQRLRLQADRKRVWLLRVGFFASLVIMVIIIHLIFRISKERDNVKSRVIASYAKEQLFRDTDLSLLLAESALDLAETEEAKTVFRTGISLLSDLYKVFTYKGSIKRLAFSPDSRYIVTTGSDPMVCEVSIDKCQSLAGHTGEIKTAEFNSDGTTIVTASVDTTARLWDAKSGNMLRELKHEDVVNSAKFSSDSRLVVTASDDGKVRIWNTDTGELIKEPVEHEEKVKVAIFSPSGNYIATDAMNRTGKIIDIRNFKELTLNDLRGPVATNDFSHDDKLLVTEGGPDMAKVWDVATGKERFLLKGHKAAISMVSFSPVEAYIVTASYDSTAKVWSATDGRLIAELTGHTGRVNSAKFSNNGKYIVTAGSDNTARMWDAKTGSLIKIFYSHNRPVNYALFSPDDKFIATASFDNTVRIWNVLSPQSVMVLNGHAGEVNSAAFNPDSSWIITTSDDSTACLWNLKDGLLDSKRVLRHVKPVNYATFSPDGKFMLTACADKEVYVWETKTGKKITSLSGHEEQVYKAKFSNDGKYIVTASADQTAIVWEVDTWKQLLSLSGHKDSIYSASFNSDGQLILTASADKVVRIWNAKTGEIVKEISLLNELIVEKDEINDANFSPDSQYVVTASDDHLARVWYIGSDSNVPKLVKVLRGHSDIVRSANFSPDGNLILTTSDDHKILVWDWKTEDKESRPITLSGHEGKVYSAIFDAKGERIVTASADGTSRIFHRKILDPLDQLRIFARERIKRKLTKEEKHQYLYEEVNVDISSNLNM
jgi:WD40 repeat protein